MSQTACLLIESPDRKGLVAVIADFLYRHDANILHADQHQDAAAGRFFMRVEWDLESFSLDRAGFEAAFQPIGERFSMQWRLAWGQRRPKIAIFVSRYLHCLADLLYRTDAGDLDCEVAMVISNHEDGRRLTEFHGVPFHHIPVTAATKADAEAEQLRLLDAAGVELVVLARYMQVLSGDFTARHPARIINVHHSFLPAFSGARPYHRAHERGVKLIGATSHYVTEVLDDGPIIEQDVLRVSHRDQLDDLIRKGRDLERSVLSRAVRWHCAHRILTYANKTVVFD